METVPCVGLAEAMQLVPKEDPDVVVCDYDLLVTTSLKRWEEDPDLASLPIVAVSLTRHPGEGHLLDINGIAGFLYLPTLNSRDARRVLTAARRKQTVIKPPNVLSWAGSTPAVRLR
jgi:CheY-like chemotaxis protein